MDTQKQSDTWRLSNQIMSLVRRLRREVQNDAESWARLLLLGAIDRSGNKATPSELAQSANMRSSNLAAALRELEGECLIERTPDPGDRRKVRVALTDAGLRLLLDSRARRERWLTQAITSTLTQEERATLLQAGELLERIAAYSGTASPAQ